MGDPEGGKNGDEEIEGGDMPVLLAKEIAFHDIYAGVQEGIKSDSGYVGATDVPAIVHAKFLEALGVEFKEGDLLGAKFDDLLLSEGITSEVVAAGDDSEAKSGIDFVLTEHKELLAGFLRDAVLTALCEEGELDEE